MFRRSRFSVRPNVGTAGRTAAAPQEAPSATQETSETPRDASESSSAAAVTDNKSEVTLPEKAPASGDGNDPNGEGTSSSAAVQRRKRFSIKPKVAPGRPATLSRTPKSPVKAVSEARVEGSGSNLDKPTTSSPPGTSAAPQGFQSPRRRRPSEETKQLKIQSKATTISPSALGPLDVPAAEDSLEQTHLPADSSKQLGNISTTQVREVPPRPPDKVPPSLPDKEAIEISEKAKTLVSSKNVLSLTQSAYSLSRLLNGPSDLQRLVKAQKLRELLRQERRKEKKLKKAKALPKEFTLDPAKMTMRDLIRYLPTSNPMTSSIEDSAPDNETVIPPSPGREASPERAQEPEVLPDTANSREDDEEEEAADEDQEEALMVPQVKVAEDGSLIIDEESLTVEVQRAKGPNPAENRDPIFERGSTTTYSSFRKGTYSKPWSSEETDMFFLAVSMVGTDFSMICQLFPHRARSEIKNKFKKEERENSWRIDKAFRERRRLDIEYFSKLLEKILEFQKSRKKLKSLAEKNSPKKRKRKTKAKKSARKLSDVEEGDEEEDENQVPDLEAEEEGEKENEDLCNEGGVPASEPKRKCKRKKDALAEEPNEKKNKTGEAGIPEDAEAALPEDHTSPDMSEKSQNVNSAKDTTIKPAKLSRGRAPKPLLPLGRKWGKKLPPSTTAKDPATEKGDECVSDGATAEQVNKDASPSSQAKSKKSASDDISSEEEDVAVKPPQPTRYGRVPKPTKPLTYPAKEEAHSSASETTAASPVGSAASSAKPKPKCPAKRRRSSKPESTPKSKKPKLVMLRASQSDFSDEDEDVEEDQLGCGSSRDGHAPIFVPANLNASQPGISEVDESMVELDILASMPDVLGISQDALCPDSSCEQAQHEAGTAEPCEHQLDLLVDVIDFLSSEHTEVAEDESYNEAAQTLLTIGNLAHIPQSAPNQTVLQDHTAVAGTSSAAVNETSRLEGQTKLNLPAQEESITPSVSAAFSQEETSQTVSTVELQGSGDMPVITTSDQMFGEQKTVCDMDPAPQSEISNISSPQTKRGRLSKVKPKPNLGQTSRIAQPKSRPETSTVRTAEESQSVAPSVSQATETLSVEEETTPKTSDCAPGLLKDSMSSTEVILTEEPSGTPKFVDQIESDAAMSDHNSSEIQSHCFSESQFEPSRDQSTRDTKSTSESTDEKLKSCVGTAEAGFNTPATSDSAVTEVEKGSHTDLVSVPKSSNKPSRVSPPEDLSEKQKEETVVPTTCQTRRGRLQKFKPKPNLPQTSRTAKSKLQTTKEPADKDSSPTPSLDLHNKTTEVEPQLTCSTSLEKQSESTDPALLNLGSTHTPAEELSTHEEKNISVGLVVQADLGATASNQTASENQQAQFEPSKEQETRGTESTSEFTNENLTSVGTTESSCNIVVTTDSTVTESQVQQGSDVDSTPVQENSGQPAIEELPVSKGRGEAASTCQLRRSRLQKPKPNLPQTSRTVRSKPQSRKDPVTLMQIVEKPPVPVSTSDSTDNTTAQVEVQPSCSSTPPEKSSHIKSTGSPSVPVQSPELGSIHKCTQELSSTEDEKTDSGCGLVSNTEASEKNVPQRRRRFPKVTPKPNLGSSTRTTKLQSDNINKLSEHCQTDNTSNVTSDKQPSDNNNAQTDQSLTEKDDKHLTSAQCSLSAGHTSIEVGPVDSDKLLDSTNIKATSSDGMALATSSDAENQSVLTESVPEYKNSEQATAKMESTKDKLSNNDPVEANPTSQEDGMLDMSSEVTETNAQQTNDPTAVSDVQLSEDASTESEQMSVLAPAASPICSDRDSSVQSTDQSELTGTSKPLSKVHHIRRGRLIKPKPNLACSSRPSQPRKIQNTMPAEAESGSCSQSVAASVDPKSVCELRPDMQESVKGVIDEFSNQSATPSDAGSSVGCYLQQQSEKDSPSDGPRASLDYVPSTQIASTPSTEGIQSYPVFSGMLPVQVPSDPDEPFFILSLTEIPVSSSGEVGNSAAEHLSYLPVTDASVQRASVCGESLVAAGDGPLASAPAIMSAEGSPVKGPIDGKDIGPDPAAVTCSTIKNPVDPHGTTAVQPGKSPETADNDETNVASVKQKLMATGRRAKPQVKSSNSGKKQTRNTLVAESVPAQTNTTQDSEHPADSVQPKAFDEPEPHKGGGSDVDTDKETLTGGQDPHSSSRAQTKQSSGTSSWKRKPKDYPPFLSRTAPKTAEKQSSPEPVASTSHDVAPTPSWTQGKEAHSTSTTSPTPTDVGIQQMSDHRPDSSDPTPGSSKCPAEASASQESDCMESSTLEEEEPTSVSQYFLSDIFTEVEEE
ncbi:transcription factor TFIIIB component B'' homolog isoform X3 [Stegastes partitus]|uniref:Transcription factor TFIIIB component B'' homolog isoform X3 n=1 Tax=Stegastes partitus TaxID=144197 RepID=A0A9Y4MW76_9TELE|nr:PREDICTED: transcription factor TFIIIB component B'' homolog isoform X3 [Stegastes partitus]